MPTYVYVVVNEDGSDGDESSSYIDGVITADLVSQIVSILPESVTRHRSTNQEQSSRNEHVAVPKGSKVFPSQLNDFNDVINAKAED